MVHHVVAASIASMIVAVVVVGTVDMAVAVTMTAIVDLLDTMIVSVARMDVVMTMVPEASTGMHQAGATIVTAAAGVTTTVVAVTPMLVEMVGAHMLRTAMLPRERLGTRTVEVETKTTVLTIGTPVDELRSANPLKVRSALPNNAPKPVKRFRRFRIRGLSTRRRWLMRFLVVFL